MTDGSLERVLDPGVLEGLEGRSTTEIRQLRSEAELAEEGISFARRLLQGRLDILRAELLRRQEAGDAAADDLLARLPSILGGDHQPTGPAHARATRLRVPPTAEAHSAALDEIVDEAALTRVAELPLDTLNDVIERLGARERALSDQRQQLFRVIDALRAELAERYRDGRASVRELLGEG